jgi:hypothetical protein
MRPELLKEFKEIYSRRFGEKLSDQEALARASAVLDLFRAVYRPVPKHKEVVYKQLEGCYRENNRRKHGG